MIHLLYSEIQEEKHKSLLNTCLHRFSKEFQEKIVKYRRWQDAQLTLLGRLLLKEGMLIFNKKINPDGIQFTKYNKPFIKDKTIQFNISHSGKIVACALTYYSTIGIDIENIHKIKVEDFKNQMTKNEQDTIFNSENVEDAFFMYWTQKEAVLKAHGNGLSIPLKSFEIKNNKTSIGSENYYLCEVPFIKAYSCHIASSEQIQYFDIKITKIGSTKFIKKRTNPSFLFRH